MYRRLLRMRVALITAILLLNACSTTPPPRPTLPAPEAPPEAPQPSIEELRAARHTMLEAIGAWRVQGKVAYRLPDDGGSATLDWRQNEDRSRLRLSGPLGVGSTRIVNEGALLRVTRDGIERLYPADGAPWLPGGALLPIPVASIQYWLRALPDPSLPVDAMDYEGVTLRSLHQKGWQVDYESFREYGGLAMPSRLKLRAPAADLTLKIVLRDWDLEPTGAGAAP